MGQVIYDLINEGKCAEHLDITDWLQYKQAGKWDEKGVLNMTVFV